jgi:apolipoprotein N-acyltransferase
MNLPRPDSRLARLVAALFSGWVLTLVSPPLNLHWLHWFSFLPLYWALRPGHTRSNAKLGYAAGWIGVFCLFFWLGETVTRFSSLPWSLSMIVVVIFATVFAIPYAIVFGPVHWLRDRLGVAWVFVIPAVQVSMEHLSPALFPYYHGVGQYEVPWVWQLTSVTGVTGLSYLVFLTNAAFAEAMYRHMEGRSQPIRAHAIVAGLFLTNLGFGAWRHGQVEHQLSQARTIQAAIIQQDTTMEERMAESVYDSIDSWVDRTAKVGPFAPDLVVWPEGSVHVNPDDERRKPKRLDRKTPRRFFEEMAAAGNYHFLIGGGTVEYYRDANGKRARTLYNSAYSFSRDGVLGQRYDKMVPLPFGEYIPFSDTFPALKDIIEGPGDFRPGDTATKFRAKDGNGDLYTYTVPICYEAILSAQMWKMADVDLFINITNDAWFGDTASPHQHAMLAAAMATQFGRPMLRIAYTGMSFVVDPHGDIRGETAPYSEAATVEPIHLLSIDTVYRRGGWLFPYLCLVGAVLAFVVARRRGGQPTEE